jgi:hypothetical protein
MAGTTIATSRTIGVNLTAASQLPLTVTGTGAIKVASGDAVYIAAALAGAVANLGTIRASGSSGVGVQAKGAASILNGGTAASAALIEGGSAGVSIYGAATLTNYGTIAATDTASAPGFSSVGAYLAGGGNVTNGSAADTKASIGGASAGVAAFGAAITLTNFGSVAGTGAAGLGVFLQDGGSIVNGSAGDTAATISGAGRNAVYASGAASVNNFGIIKGARNGVELRAGGSVVNGSAADTKATISGARYGVYISTYAGGAGPFAVTNFGTISGTGRYGVGLYGAGSVVNGSTADALAAIGGRGGVYVRGVGAVTNFGTITGNVDAAVELLGGGTVTNGSATAKAAAIVGVRNSAIYAANASATVLNFGRLNGSGTAVVFESGGTLVNGSSADLTAAISSTGGNAFYTDGLASVTNFGTISSTSEHNHSAVDLYAGGTVVNGSSADTAALISSTYHNGIIAENNAISVTNYGTILAPQDDGLDLKAGGALINGSVADTKATIIGKFPAFYADAAATVTNYGTLASPVYTAVSLYKDGGSITNFASGRITGFTLGVYARGAATNVTNLGTITGTKFDGVFLDTGGSVINGGSNDDSATISGPSGVYAINSAAATITNFGTISATGAAASAAVLLKDDGFVLNEATGTITGTEGVVFAPTATGNVVNFGTISNTSGATGTAIQFGGGAERLVVDPGAVFIGKVFGGTGTNVLELAAGTKAGSIGGIGSQFSNFGTMQLDTGATWMLTGVNSIGSLTENGALTVTGSLAVTAGIAAASTGTIELGAAATLAVENVLGKGPAIAFLGADHLIVGAPGSFGLHVGSTSYTGPLLEHFGAADTIDLIGIAPASAGVTLHLNYTAATGLLAITSPSAGAPPLASLLFQNSSLGGGTFHLTQSGHDMLLTHS